MDDEDRKKIKNLFILGGVDDFRLSKCNDFLFIIVPLIRSKF